MIFIYNIWIDILFVSILGTLCHYLYEWTNKTFISSILFAVNESTWEHIKISLTPSYVLIIIQLLINCNCNNFILAVFIELLTLIIVIPVIFYGYQLIFKKQNVLVNILIFYVAVCLSQIFFHLIINSNRVNIIFTYLSSIGIAIITYCYLTFTLFPPKNLLFEDPITKKYGVIRK